jgi:hypothetical protein
MMKLKLAEQFNHSINNWLTEPETNAAGRIGLFRILFSLFYLWHLSSRYAERLSFFPTDYHLRILLLDLFPKPLLPIAFELMESVLVAALILLAIGFRVRLVTAIVLVIGCILEAYYQSIDSEHATVFLAFYIPLFMLLDCRWGDTYSLDALLQRRKHRITVARSDDSWQYFLSARASLVVLAVLFFTSLVYKLIGGTWIGYPDLMSNHVLKMNIRSAIYGLPLDPLAPTIAQTPLLHNSLRFFTLLFEGLFPLVLINRKLRNFFVALALVFHSANAIWFVVTFTPILIVYALYVDWQALRERWLPKQFVSFDAISSRSLTIASISLAVAVGILWNAGEGLRSLLDLYGWLDWRTIWYPILPLSLFWFGIASVNLFRRKEV